MLGELQLGQATAGMALDPVSRKAFVSNYTSGTLSVIGNDTDDVVSIPVGANPRRLLHDANLQRTYIVNDTTPGTVTVFDARTNTVMATIPVGKRPRGISADFQRGEVYVSNQDSNTMSVIDTATNTVTATVPVGSSPFMGDVDTRLGRVYVVSQLDRVVHVIDQATKTVLAQVVTGRAPNAATVDERTGKVYVNNVTDQSVDVIDPVTFAKKTIVNTGAGSNFGSVTAVYHRYYLPNQTDFHGDDHRYRHRRDREGRAGRRVTAAGRDRQRRRRHLRREPARQLGHDPGCADRSGHRLVWRRRQSVAARPGHEPGVHTERETERARFGLDRDGNTLGDTAIATEYYHAAFIIISDSVGGVETACSRTACLAMRGTARWTSSACGRRTVRTVSAYAVFSDAFGAKSSHFNTPAGAECDSLKAGAVWQFEAMSYFVELPDAAGSCRSGTAPLYRAYKQRHGRCPQSPHHRQQGSTRCAGEPGVGRRRVGALDAVVACTPTLRGDEM